MGGALADHDEGLARIGGVLVVVFGVVVLGVRATAAWSVSGGSSRRCRRVGPVGDGRRVRCGVDAVRRAAARRVTRRRRSHGAWQGAGLLFAYSVGLGVPFLVAALACSPRGRAGRLAPRAVTRWVEPAAGAVLVVIGVALAAGWYTDLISPLVPRLSSDAALWPVSPTGATVGARARSTSGYHPDVAQPRRVAVSRAWSTKGDR